MKKKIILGLSFLLPLTVTPAIAIPLVNNDKNEIIKSQKEQQIAITEQEQYIIDRPLFEGELNISNVVASSVLPTEPWEVQDWLPSTLTGQKKSDIKVEQTKLSHGQGVNVKLTVIDESFVGDKINATYDPNDYWKKSGGGYITPDQPARAIILNRTLGTNEFTYSFDTPQTMWLRFNIEDTHQTQFDIQTLSYRWTPSFKYMMGQSKNNAGEVNWEMQKLIQGGLWIGSGRGDRGNLDVVLDFREPFIHKNDQVGDTPAYGVQPTDFHDLRNWVEDPNNKYDLTWTLGAGVWGTAHVAKEEGLRAANDLGMQGFFPVNNYLKQNGYKVNKNFYRGESTFSTRAELNKYNDHFTHNYEFTHDKNTGYTELRILDVADLKEDEYFIDKTDGGTFQDMYFIIQEDLNGDGVYEQEKQVQGFGGDKLLSEDGETRAYLISEAGADYGDHDNTHLNNPWDDPSTPFLFGHSELKTERPIPKSGLSAGTQAWIISGSVIGGLALFGGAYYWVRTNKKKNT